MQETWVQSLSEEDPLEKGMQPTLVLLPRESHGQRSLVGCSPWGCTESDTTGDLAAAAAALQSEDLTIHIVVQLLSLVPVFATQ